MEDCIMATLFSRIAAGEIPSYKVAEDDSFFAFLDINPVQAGHTLVIPRREIDNIFDLSQDEYADLQRFAWRVAQAVKAAVPCRKIGVAVIGLEVPHAHIHLIPITNEGDMDFNNKKTLPAEQMERLAADIARNFK